MPTLHTCTVCGVISDMTRCPRHRTEVYRPDSPWKWQHDRAAQKRFRRAVLKRDGNRCTHCGATEDLRACHLRALHTLDAGDPLRYDPSNGVTLCASCDRKTDRFAR